MILRDQDLRRIYIEKNNLLVVTRLLWHSAQILLRARLSILFASSHSTISEF